MAITDRARRPTCIPIAIILAVLAVGLGACGSSGSSSSSSQLAGSKPASDSPCSILTTQEVSGFVGVTVSAGSDNGNPLQCLWNISDAQGHATGGFQLSNSSGTFEVYHTHPWRTQAEAFADVTHSYDKNGNTYEQTPGVGDSVLLPDNSSNWDAENTVTHFPDGFSVVVVKGLHVFLAGPVHGAPAAQNVAALLASRLCDLPGPYNGPC